MTEAAKNGVGIKLPPPQRRPVHAKSLTPFSLASSHAPLLDAPADATPRRFQRWSLDLTVLV